MNRCGNWQKYQSDSPLQRLLIRRFLNAAASIIRPMDVHSVLDVGSAEGFVAQRLQEERPDLRIVGVDIDNEALARGRELHPAITFLPGSATALPFADQAFDLVTCNEVLEHLPEPERALSELQRVTRGYCLLSVPHEPLFCIGNLMRGKNLSRFGRDEDHCQTWSAIRFRTLAAQYFRPLVKRYPLPWQVFLGAKRR